MNSYSIFDRSSRYDTESKWSGTRIKYRQHHDGIPNGVLFDCNNQSEPRQTQVGVKGRAVRRKCVGLTILFVLSLSLGMAPHLGSESKIPKSHSKIVLTEDEREWLRKHRTIRLGIDPNWPPIEFVGEDGVHSGIAAEVVRIVSQRIGISMKVEEGLTWPQVMAKAKKREIDVLPCAAQTYKREGFLLFSMPYLNIPVVIVTRIDADYIGGLKDLKGKTVAVIKDYQLHERLPGEYPAIDLLVVNSAEEALRSVSDGRAYAFAGNLASTSYLIPKLGITNLKVSAPTPYSYVLAFAVRQDWPELVDILNKALLTISQVERTEIAQRWVAWGLHQVDYVLVLKVAGIAGAILLVILIWNFQIRRQREALRRSEERLQNIVDSMPNVVFVTDLDGRKQLVNNEWERVTGLKRVASIGKTYQEVFRKELAEKFQAYDRKVLETLEPLSTEETAKTHGGERTFIYNLVPLLDTVGHPYAICGTTTDITERKRAEQELQRAFAESNRHLSEAAEYVRTLLPKPMNTRSIRTDWRFVPSAALGGDCLGYHWLDDDHFSVYLVDVSGHGVSAALLAVTITNVLRSRSLKDVDFRKPDQVLGSLNEVFPMEEQNDMYFTIWYGVLSPTTRTLVYSSGGHPPALLLNRTSEGNVRTDRLLTPNIFVGGMTGIEFKTGQVDLPGPCRLYIYSDGVYEIERDDGTLWGLNNLERFIRTSSTENESVLDSLLHHVVELNRTDSLEDDLSILEVVIE